MTVVETGSFAVAGRSLGYTQSAISQQIATLERLVDQQLLVRHRGGRQPTTPTPAGQLLLDHSRAVLARVNAAHADMLSHVDQTQIRLATSPSIGVDVVSEVIRRFVGATGVRVEILEGHSERELHAYVEAGEAEFAFVTLPAPEDFAAIELGTDPYVAVVPARSELARRRFVAIDALHDCPLIGNRLQGHEETVARALSELGLTPKSFDRYDDSRLIQSLVAAGNGIAIVPLLTVDLKNDAIRALELRPCVPPRRIAIIHHRDRQLSNAACTFLKRAVLLCRAALENAKGTEH